TAIGIGRRAIGVQHQYPGQVLKVAVEERNVKPEGRKGTEQRFPVLRPEGHLERVVLVANSALVIMCLRTQLLPTRRIAASEVNAFVFRRLDVIGPEESDIAPFKHVL